jgi:hypothetical protein
MTNCTLLVIRVTCTLPAHARSSHTSIFLIITPLSTINNCNNSANIDQQRLKERAIKAALRDCALKDPPNYSTIAKKHSTKQFQINRSTLSRRHRGKTTSQAEYISNVSRALSDIQEDTLVLVINKYTARGIPPTSIIVKNFAEELYRYELDKN